MRSVWRGGRGKGGKNYKNGSEIEKKVGMEGFGGVTGCSSDQTTQNFAWRRLVVSVSHQNAEKGRGARARKWGTTDVI